MRPVPPGLSGRPGGKRPVRECTIAIALIVGVWYLVANSGDDGEVLPDELDITIDEGGGEQAGSAIGEAPAD